MALGIYHLLYITAIHTPNTMPGYITFHTKSKSYGEVCVRALPECHRIYYCIILFLWKNTKTSLLRLLIHRQMNEINKNDSRIFTEYCVFVCALIRGCHIQLISICATVYALKHRMNRENEGRKKKNNKHYIVCWIKRVDFTSGPGSAVTFNYYLPRNGW